MNFNIFKYNYTLININGSNFSNRYEWWIIKR